MVCAAVSAWDAAAATAGTGDDGEDNTGAANNNSSMVCNVRPHAAPANPVARWIGQDTTKPHTLCACTKSANCCRDDGGIFRAPLVRSGKE